MLTLALALVALQDPALPDDHALRRQFDFWRGEWSVQNRHLQADGTWADSGRARARITPVLGGDALLEEWGGHVSTGAPFMNGFSLRAYDAAQEKWKLLLFWTVDGSAGFGTLEGAFRHGRGEFFSSWKDQAGDDVVQRYSFSDALPSSLRWDSALSKDGRQTWRTDWIMEFSRTAPAADVTEDKLFAEVFAEGALDKHPEARALDFALGTWTGADGEGRHGRRLRCKTLSKGALVLAALDGRASSGAGEWEPREVWVAGYAARAGAWEAWSLDRATLTMTKWRGAEAEGRRLVFTRAAQDGPRRVVWELADDGGLTIEESGLTDGDWTERRTLRLLRD